MVAFMALLDPVKEALGPVQALRCSWLSHDLAAVWFPHISVRHPHINMVIYNKYQPKWVPK